MLIYFVFSDQRNFIDNDIYIIDAFTIGLFLHEETTSLIDDRDWDSFNVYGKVTNHEGITTRECNDNGVCDGDESLVDCFDDCCLIAGTGENEEWCLVENIVGISNFEDVIEFILAGASLVDIGTLIYTDPN